MNPDERQPPSNANRDPLQRPAPTPRAPYGGDRKVFKSKGHDRQLEDAQYAQTPVLLTLMHADTQVRGTIVKRDKFTITLRTDEGRTVIFYKHAIESITIDLPRTES